MMTPLLLGATMLAAGAVEAKVFYSQEEALEVAFPDCDEVRERTYILGPKQVREIETRARSKLESEIVTLHSGWKQGELIGHAMIEVHQVRTKAEAFMVVIDPQGNVASLMILAFHEPLDYLPPKRWYDQFVGLGLGDDMRVGRDIHSVVNATLSTQAVARAVRRALAIYQVLVGKVTVE